MLWLLMTGMCIILVDYYLCRRATQYSHYISTISNHFLATRGNLSNWQISIERVLKCVSIKTIHCRERNDNFDDDIIEKEV